MTTQTIPEAKYAYITQPDRAVYVLNIALPGHELQRVKITEAQLKNIVRTAVHMVVTP